MRDPIQAELTDMAIRMVRLAVIAVLLLLVSCSISPLEGTEIKQMTRYRYLNACDGPGATIIIGNDLNSDGILSGDEVTDTTIICGAFEWYEEECDICPDDE